MAAAEDEEKFVINGPEPLEPLPEQTLGHLLYEKLMLNPNRNNLMVDVHTGRTLSYSDMYHKTCALAHTMEKHGYGKNTVISVISENSLEFFVPVISALYMGAIVAPVNHNYTGLELTHCLDISKPKVVFCSKETHQTILNLQQKDLKYIERVIVIDCYDDKELCAGAQSLESFVAGEPQDGFFLEYFDPKTQGAFILCSSGTTGMPKGVLLSHTNIMTRYMHTIDPRYTVVEDGSSFLGILPFFHGYGLITNLLMMACNQQIVMLKKFQEDVFLKAIQDYKIPALWLVPPLIVLLAKSPSVDKYDLSSVKEITSGAAPLSRETEEAVKKRLNVKVIRQAYGLTEATLAVVCMGPNEIRHGSSGKVVSYMSCKIRDPETGKTLGPRAIGEICVKGPMVMLGYYGNEKATKETFTEDGWLLSGDMGYYDEDGYFFIVDRLKELIKYKGFQVAPAELEAVLLTNPKIREAAVVGVPNEDSGELPLAFVVKNPGVSLTEEEVKKYVSDRVSHQKWLRGGVIFVSAVPKSPSGKILRKDLRLLLKEYLSKNKKSKL